MRLGGPTIVRFRGGGPSSFTPHKLSRLMRYGTVIPAQAGIQKRLSSLGSRVRGNDNPLIRVSLNELDYRSLNFGLRFSRNAAMPSSASSVR